MTGVNPSPVLSTDLTSSLDIFGDLLAESTHRVIANLRSEPLQELDPERLPIGFFIEVQQVGLDDKSVFFEGGCPANADGGRVATAAQFAKACVDALGGNQLIARIDVGRWKPHPRSPADAVDDLAQQGVWASEADGRLIDGAGGEQLPNK